MRGVAMVGPNVIIVVWFCVGICKIVVQRNPQNAVKVDVYYFERGEWRSKVLSAARDLVIIPVFHPRA
jgi:hypothetical protein